MWSSGAGGRDGVTSKDVVTSALAEIESVLVIMGLSDVVEWAVEVMSAVAEDVTVEVRVWVAVEGYVEETDCGCVPDQVLVM